MSDLLTGREVAAALTVRTKEASDRMREAGHIPELMILRVGSKKSDLSYEKGIRKRAEEAGVEVAVSELPESAAEEEVVTAVQAANQDSRVSGILLFLPLPKGLDERRIVNTIAPEKDMDGATDASMLGIYRGIPEGFPPCTAQAVIEILDYYGIDPAGKNAVIVGRSLVVGKPLSLMLIKRNATVTVCHTKTKNLQEITKRADILISAAGHPRTITAEHVSPGQIIIDVGINFNSDGKMIGDVAFDEVSPIVASITPVPGGVGSVTNAVLLSHAVS